MGTRGLTAVMADGKYQIAQYGQWDHYPSGQGITTLEFCCEHLKTQAGRDAFKAKLANVKFSESEVELEGSTYEREVSDFSVPCDPGAHHRPTKKIQYPYAGRDTGAEILELVFKSSDTVCLNDSIGFAGESLFCEYAYVVDLDKNTLEVFKGFNQRKLGKTQRFKDFFQKVERQGANQYHPVRLLKKYSLDKLPSNESFLEDLEEKDEDELPAAPVAPTLPETTPVAPTLPEIAPSALKLLKGGA